MLDSKDKSGRTRDPLKVKRNFRFWQSKKQKNDQTNENYGRFEDDLQDNAQKTSQSKAEGDLCSITSVQTSQWVDLGDIKQNSLDKMETDINSSDNNVMTPQEDNTRILRLRSLRRKLAQTKQNTMDLRYHIERIKNESDAIQFQLISQQTKNKQLADANTECLVRIVENDCLEESVKKLKEQLDIISKRIEQSRIERRHLRCATIHLEVEMQRLTDETFKLETEKAQQRSQLEMIQAQCEQMEADEDNLIQKQELIGRFNELCGTIKVFLRIRNIKNTCDTQINQPPFHSGCIKIHSEESISLTAKRELFHANDASRITQFNHVFLPDTPQNMVYHHLSSQFLRIFDGSNTVILFHGTGNSGKTFSCCGNQNHPGIASLAVSDLLDCLSAKKNTKNESIYVSFIEIYNDHVMCLLSKKVVRLTDTGPAVYVQGQTEELITSTSRFNELLNIARIQRKSIHHKKGQIISRSHMFIVVKYVCTISTTDIRHMGTILLGDLASSRTLKLSGLFERDRLIKQENWYIQRSLMHLSNAMHQMNKTDWVNNCRGTRLTELLKPCFIGSCYFILFLTVTNEPSSMKATQNIIELGRAVMNASLERSVS